MVGGRRRVVECGFDLIFLQLLGDAHGRLALLIPLRPTLARSPGYGRRRFPGGFDQLDGFVDPGWNGLRLWGRGLIRLDRNTGRAGLLELVEFAAGFVGFAAEADGAAAEAKLPVQGYVRFGGLAEGFQRMKAEADDVGGEVQFVLGLRVVGGNHLAGRLVRRAEVATGAEQEQPSEVSQDRFKDRGLDGGNEGHGVGHGAYVRSLFEWTIGEHWIDFKNYFS